MAIKYPVDCITDRDKLEGMYSAYEKLRILHNLVNKWHRKGVTAQERTIIINKFPSLGFIQDQLLPVQQWEQFINNYFMPYHFKILSETGRIRNLMKKSTLFNVEVDET